MTSDNQLAVNGNWYHVAGWYDGLSASVAINGMRVSAVCGSAPNLGSGPIVAGGPFYVGGILNNGNAVIEPFAGLIDEVRVRPVAAQPYVPGGRVSCPTGFTLIGTPGSRMAFCISSNKEPSQASYVASLAACYNKTPSERAEVCTTQQWTSACASGTPLSQPLGGGTYEWTLDFAYGSNHACMTSCNAWNDGSWCNPTTASYSYRCCLR